MVVTEVSNDVQVERRWQCGRTRSRLYQAEPGGRGVSPQDRRPAPQTIGCGRGRKL